MHAQEFSDLYFHFFKELNRRYIKWVEWFRKKRRKKIMGSISSLLIKLILTFVDKKKKRIMINIYHFLRWIGEMDERDRKKKENREKK